MSCNQSPDENVAAVPVEVDGVDTTHEQVMSLGVISTIIAFITFVGMFIGFALYSLYWKLRGDKYAIEINEGVSSNPTLAANIPSYSTFPNV